MTTFSGDRYAQPTLDGMAVTQRRGGPFGDLHGVLPERVWPSTVGALERDGRVLFLHSYKRGQAIHAAQDRLWRKLSRLPGCSLAVLWGAAHGREGMIAYVDGEQQPQIAVTTGEFRQYVRAWWG